MKPNPPLKGTSEVPEYLKTEKPVAILVDGSFFLNRYRYSYGNIYTDGPTKVAKNLQRYVNEFAGRHNSREQDTVDQMTVIARGFVGKRLRYRELIA